MESTSLVRIAAALLLALPVVACGPSDETDRAKSGPIVGPFLVSDFFTPSGLMGDGAVPGRVTVDINKNCKEPRPPGAQGDCYRFIYKVGEVRWAGAYWVFPANNWGTARGRRLVGPVDFQMPNPEKPGDGNLRGYNYVRFYAAVAPMPKDPFVQYWAGRLDGRKATPPQPYYDVGCSIFPGTPPMCTEDKTLPDNTVVKIPAAFSPTEDGASVTPQWQQFKVDLSRWSVDEVIGGFGFSSNDTANPGVTQVIYFDDIVWE